MAGKKKYKCREMIRNKQFQDLHREQALKSQERYRKKEILKFYVTGRPIFNTTFDVQRTLIGMGYIGKGYSTF